MNTKNTLIVGSLLFVSVSLFAQEKKDTKMSAKEQKEQKAWMSYMTPGEMHKMLANANGDWHETRPAGFVFNVIRLRSRARLVTRITHRTAQPPIAGK